MTVYPHPLPATVSHAARDLAWFAGGSACAFAIPYLGVTVLDLQHDVYYLVYFAAVVLLVGAYVRIENVDVRAPFRPCLRPEVGNVLISIPAFATANPAGAVVAHVAQHLAAVTHAYESKIFNPPTTSA